MTAKAITQTNVNNEAEPATMTSHKTMSRISTGLFLGAAILLIISIAFPYWGLVLEAPQYPGGLELRVFVNYMTGDDDPRLDEVSEIDGLNHYIGMKSLYDAAQFERSIALPGVAFMVVSLIAVAFWRRKWVWLLALPVIAFPFVYLGDLAFWLFYYGQNLDPYAPLSSAIEPFTPPLLGEGIIGQFKTVAGVQLGWFLALGSALMVVIALALRYYNQRHLSEV